MNVELRKAEIANDRARGVRPSKMEGGVPRRLVLLLALLAALTAAGLLGLDRATAELVRTQEPNWLRSVAVVLSLIGALCISATVAVVLLVKFWRFRPHHAVWRASLWMLTAEAICSLLVRLLKIGFGRWRPDQVLAGQFEFFNFKSKCNSFPSGHTADAAVTATVLWFVYPRLRPLYVAWVLLISVARFGAARHFVADAASGAAIGILCAWMVKRGLDVYFRQRGRTQ